MNHQLTQNNPDAWSASYRVLAPYLLGYFILVPGTLFCYQAGGPSKLSILASSGTSFFWRFIRITLLTAIVSAIVLVPLFLLQNAWMEHVDNHVVGRSAFLHELAGWLVFALVAAILRLYFDLVEVYTVQLADRYLPNGKPDRRVRRTLLPALQTLRRNFARAYGIFLLLGVLGFAAVALTARIVLHMLAQPRVWPMFLLAQAGLLGMMASRFWQRAAETVLACDNPLPYPEPIHNPYLQGPFSSMTAPTLPPNDPQPDPEPAPPSLPEPDPGVFHHEAGKTEE